MTIIAKFNPAPNLDMKSPSFSAASRRRSLILLAAMAAPSLGFAQTWSAAGSGNWSTAGNWNPASVPTTGNTAILGDTASNRTVTYDSGASGTLGTLTINQTSAAINTLDIQKSLSLTNALTLGASGGGTARVNLGSSTAAGFTLTATNGITLNSGGSLLYSATTNAAGTAFNTGSASSTTPITVAGGTLTLSATTGSNTSGTAISSIGGNLTMSSGAIVIDNATGAGGRRLALNGASINITGGSISATKASGAQIQFNNTGSASTIVFNPSSYTAANIGFNFQSSQSQTFSTNQTITATTDLRDIGVKTFTSTASGNGIGQLQFWDSNSSTVGSAATLRLGSNLTLNSGATQPGLHTSSAAHSVDSSNRVDAAIDTNGFTLDLSAGAGSGVWTPNAVSTFASGYTLSGSGSIKANAFNLSTTNVTTNLGSGLVLNAVGGNATANDLGSSGTVNSASIFRYSGAASTSNPATLTWARNIGSIEVIGGALKLNTTATLNAGASKISVTNGGTLSIGSEANLGTAPASVVSDFLTLNGGTLAITGTIQSWSANRGITLGASGGTIDVGSSLNSGPGPISGAGALTKTGTGYMRANANTFSGGFVLNQGWVRPTAFSSVVDGVVTSGPLGTGTLTINGGGLSGSSGFAPTYFVSQTLVNADFGVNTGAFGTNQANRVDFAGPISLQGAQRTVSLGRYTTAVASIGSGNSSLNFTSSNSLNTSIGNGTIRFVRESLGTASDYSAVNFDQTSFTSGAGLVVGSNIITTMSQANPFGAVDGNQPRVTVESGGYFNMSDSVGARSPQIRSLAGAGVVTSLTASGTSTLTINPQTGDTATFTGQIVDGSSLNGTLGTTSAAVVALSKTGTGTQILSGSNSYSGGTTVSAGTLELSGGSLGSGGVAISGGSLNLGGATVTNMLGAVTGGTLSNGSVSNDGGIFDVQSGSISAVLAGTNGLVKSGSGVVTLGAANTYGGDTTISAGTLAIGSSGSIASSPVITNNGVLDVSAVSGFTIGASQTLKGSGDVTGNLAISGAFQPGSGPGFHNISGNLTLNSGATTTLEVGGTGQGTSFDYINVGGNVVWGGALSIVDFGAYNVSAQDGRYGLFGVGGSWTGNFSGVSVGITSLSYNATLGAWTGNSGQSSYIFSLSDGALTVSAVPEPATFGALAGFAVIGCAAFRRRRI